MAAECGNRDWLVLVGFLCICFFEGSLQKVCSNRKSRLDKLLLTVSVLPIAAAIGGFYYFDDQAQWIRVIALLVAVGEVAVDESVASAAGSLVAA